MVDTKDNPSLVYYTNLDTNKNTETDLLKNSKYSKIGSIFGIIVLFFPLVGFVYSLVILLTEENLGLGGLAVVSIALTLFFILFILSTLIYISSENIIIKIKNNNVKIPILLKVEHIISSTVSYLCISSFISFIISPLLYSVASINSYNTSIRQTIFIVCLFVIFSIFIYFHFRKIFKIN